MPASIVLSHGATRIEVAVDAGGRIAQIHAGDQPLLIDPATDPASTGWGSFPMAPWVGRIRHGRFRYLGVDHELATNHQDGMAGDPDRRHAIHGTVFARPWTVVGATDATVELTCELAAALDWPFAGTAHQRFEVGARHVRCELAVSAAERPFPGEVGWHPWFRKPAELVFEPAAMYERDRLGLPTGELVEPAAGPWDDCFVQRGPMTLHYDRHDAAAVIVESDCDHWVVYDEPAHATCVEPQSGPPDAVSIRPRLVLPGHPLRRTMTVSW